MGKLNSKLQNAKKAKNDEFYTQLTDIEKELYHYRTQFKGKVVFCNCDDPSWSNFFKYFWLNFKFLGLKKLITTHYETDKPSYKIEVLPDENGNPILGDDIPLESNGDFRSPECIEILKEADVVVTNPPFSLFREYIAQLVKYNKQFLVIGNMNAITYKEIFPLIKENKLWLGVSIRSGDREFEVPPHVVDMKKFTGKVRNGKYYQKVMGVRWFTNMHHAKRNEELILFRKYNEKDYPTYDNYDAINVDRTAEIPMDYAGVMGVPISFLDKHNPNQFDIIDINPHFFALQAMGLPNPKQLKITGRKDPYARVLIQRKQHLTNQSF